MSSPFDVRPTAMVSLSTAKELAHRIPEQCSAWLLWTVEQQPLCCDVRVNIMLWDWYTGDIVPDVSVVSVMN